MVLLCAVISQGHMIKGSRDFMGGYHHAKLGGQRHYGRGDLMILVDHMILKDHMITFWSWSCYFMGRSPSRSLPSQVGSHGHSGSRRIMVLVFQLISQDHVITGHVVFWARAPQGKSPPCHVHIHEVLK